MIRKCIYESCDNTFKSKSLGYVLCPKCGAATIPLDTKITPKGTDKLKYLVDNYSKCQFAYDCIATKDYKPQCEHIGYTI